MRKLSSPVMIRWGRPVLNAFPQFLMHGNNDSNVSIKVEEDYVRTMHELTKNINLTLTTFPSDNHQFTDALFN
ncbi:hypothetical protein [Sporolactobacillus pectinivorans]|uniref:hypothetical protein n=1 Tax=Sporolactobacillus pectinivorans TaxID=1591408 RepID=UPI000C25FFA9|nr:hypothetical protein [Sporolactobacillus pectinivorans]